MTPTDDQLARFVAVTVYGPGYAPYQVEVAKVLISHPPMREVWLARHREFQEWITA